MMHLISQRQTLGIASGQNNICAAGDCWTAQKRCPLRATCVVSDGTTRYIWLKYGGGVKEGGVEARSEQREGWLGRLFQSRARSARLQRRSSPTSTFLRYFPHGRAACQVTASRELFCSTSSATAPERGDKSVSSPAR